MSSKCMDIINGMAQEDQDTLLEKLDQYIALGVAPEKAQRMAANDLMEEIKAESAEFLRLVAEQHPDTVEAAEVPLNLNQGAKDDRPANTGDQVADKPSRDASGSQGIRGDGGAHATSGFSGGPQQPGATDARYSQRDHHPDERRAVAELEAALRGQKGGGKGIKADPASLETQALNALLDSFADLTGRRGIAIDWADGPYGVQMNEEFFVNTQGADVHVAHTIGHEFTHISEQYPGLAAMYDKLFSLVGERGRAEYFDYLRRTDQVKSASLSVATPTEIRKLQDEMLADFMGQRFNDKAWLEQLAKEEPRLFGEFVRDWLALLSQLIDSLKGRVGGVAVKNIDGYIAQLEEAKAIAKEVAVVWAERNPERAAEVLLTWKTTPDRSTGMMRGIGWQGEQKDKTSNLSKMRDVFDIFSDVSRILGWGNRFDKNGRYKEVLGPASSKGITEIGIQSTLALGDKLDERTRNEIEFFLATRGMWLGLDSVSWHAPMFGQDGLGVEFNLGGHQLDSDQFEELAAATRREFHDYNVTPIQAADGVRFLNFTGLEQAEFNNKLKKAINDTSIYDIWKHATDASTEGRAPEGVDRSAGATLRPGSSDLSRGRDHVGNAFTPEGIRTFGFLGGVISNDWSRGEGQFRDRAVKAWRVLKDLPHHPQLPSTEAKLNDFLDETQARIDGVNFLHESRNGGGKSSLTAQERATGIGVRFEYPSSQISTERAKTAYFRHPDGQLETLYHGTASILNEVVAGVGPATKTGAVFYASSAPEYAEERALSGARRTGKWRDKNVGANIIPVHILAANPFDWRIKAHADAVIRGLGTIRGYKKPMAEEMIRTGDWRAIETAPAILAIKAAGFDSFLIRDDSSQRGHIGIGLFDPQDVVFAIGLNGQKLAQPDIKFSARDSNQGVNEAALNKGVNKDSHLAQMRKRVAAKNAERKIVGRTTRRYTPEQLAAFANVGFAVKPVSLKERAQALWKDAGKKLAQGLADQFAPIKALSTEAYGLLRLAKGAAGSFETLLKGGMLKLTDGVYDFDEARRGGVIDKLLIPMQGEHHDFLRWVAANRAEHLTGQDKEHLFTPDDITAIKSLADGDLVFDYTLQHGPQAGQVTRNRAEMYADSLVTFNAFNDNVMDMAEQSGLIDPEARALWSSEFYVPFFRATESGGVVGASMKGGAVRKQAFKALKGGTDMLSADLLDNTLMNWAGLLDASAKNRAAKASLEAAEAAGVAIGTDEETARQMGKSTGNSDGTVWFMDGGVKHYYLVSDPFVLTAITSLEYVGMRNPVMNAMSAMKNALTVGVTSSPFFKIRNLIRDSIQVIGVGNISYNPLTNLKDGWALTKPENDVYFRLLAGGGTIHFGTMLEGSEAKRVQALVESGVDAATILGDEHKVKAFYRKFIEPGITAYNELGNRGEAINRAALYDQLIKQGVSHADASLQARDLMDFSMQGSFATVRFLTQVLPFANSRLQGLYKLGKSAKENPKRMAYVTGAVALASLALLAMYGDDDDWKKREDWDRDNYWWFKFGGTAFRIPKPFELGAIGTLAERSAELVFDKEMTGKHFRGHVLSLLGDNLAMNPVPQLVKPMLDVYANRDSFSGRPIETMGMERLKSDYRFTGNTSMTARATSTTLNAVTGLVGKESMSPVQVDSLIRGYFGWLGMFAVGVVDIGARQAIDQPTRPSSDLWKTASGGMVSKLEGTPSRYVTQVYEQAKVLEEAYGTWHALQKQGKVEEAREFKAANDEHIQGYRNVEAIKGAIAKINQRIRAVESGGMGAQEKRTEINRLNKMKDQFARRLAA